MTKQSQITNNLADFYTAEAEKFYNTRKKNIWPEFDHILSQINQIQKDYIYILELGCGDGRFYEFLKINCNKKFSYLWVDISEGLINIAKRNYPIQENILDRQVQDMINFTSQELLVNKYDVVISIAAVQHIYSEANRVKLFDNIYNITNYEGKLIMTNWSFSHRFIKKYYKILRKSLVSKLFTNHDICDLYIPWKSIWSDKKVYDRYYHIFLINELKKICLKCSRIIDKIWYIDNAGNFVQNWKNSRNSLLVAIKDVIK